MKLNFCPDYKVLPSRSPAQRFSHLGSSSLPWRLSERTRLDNRNSQLPGFPERPTRSNSRWSIAADPPKGLRFNRHIRSFPAGRRTVAIEWCRRHSRTCQRKVAGRHFSISGTALGRKPRFESGISLHWRQRNDGDDTRAAPDI